MLWGAVENAGLNPFDLFLGKDLQVDGVFMSENGEPRRGGTKQTVLAFAAALKTPIGVCQILCKRRSFLPALQDCL